MQFGKKKRHFLTIFDAKFIKFSKKKIFFDIVFDALNGRIAKKMIELRALYFFFDWPSTCCIFI